MLRGLPERFFAAGLVSLTGLVFGRSQLMRFLEEPFAFNLSPQGSSRRASGRRGRSVPLTVRVNTAESESPGVYDLSSPDLVWRRASKDCVREAFWIWRGRRR